ncbi:hypothetical protein Tdes44962_MAKER06518 [Teratosphaeria destructans]|uniref:Uncharacterized protein n=1 Tax=Teratosphaeria destructans TaxID=418781 RepID=A0A9W7W6Z1_9PEZI|nr:hypothetical protein Tdes44962_MAKER06518 [Teratosphaeria destructans]
MQITQSTAKGEITFARSVCTETNPEVVSARKPVAQLWSTRSHAPRYKADFDCKSMRLEIPRFRLWRVDVGA